MHASTIGALLVGFLLATANAQVSDSAVSNSAGAFDTNYRLGRIIGDANTILGGGLFVPRKGKEFGAFLEANKNGNGASLLYSATPDFNTTFQQNAFANLLNKNNHKLDASAYHARTNPTHGDNFDQFGGKINYNNGQKYSVSLHGSHIPQGNSNTLGIDGKANLWTSNDGRHSTYVHGGISRNFNEQFPGKFDSNIGLGWKYNFLRKFVV